MDLPAQGILELLYVELVGESTAAAAPDLVASARAAWAGAPGCLGLQGRLEQDGRRLLLLTAWTNAAARDSWRASPAGRAWSGTWAARGARTARSLWAGDPSRGWTG
ncbi:MAG: antibiotic biosynthesis monooxygenase [Planctomycetota bacterium]